MSRQLVITLSMLAGLVLASAASAVTPTNGGAAGGTATVIDTSQGPKGDPHVSGPLVSYTDLAGLAYHVRYYDFATGVSTTVPPPPPRLPGASWIWAPGVTGSTSPAQLAQFYFTKTITLAAAPTAATFQLAVDNFAEVRVNGTIVGTYGSTSDFTAGLASQQTFKSFDILPQLTSGSNTITIRAQNAIGFGACTTCTYQQNPAGVIFGGSITAGGSTTTFASDTSWQVFADDPTAAGATPIGFAENYCLNASSPQYCPSGATLFDHPGGSWTANDVFSLDFLSDVDGSSIVFARQIGIQSAIMLFDTTTGAATEIAPQATSSRYFPAIGGSTIAFVDYATGNGAGDIFAYDLAANTLQAVGTAPEIEQNVAVSPSGNAVVWERCAT